MLDTRALLNDSSIASYNNNNNKAFKYQTSWGRLELKPSRSNQGSGTKIALIN